MVSEQREQAIGESSTADASSNVWSYEGMNDPEVIEEMLRTARTIAVVGMSDKTWRASHNIGRYLAGKGYHVLPVNPALQSIADLTCYSDLDAAQAAALAEGGGVDLVDVFRAPE